MLSQRIITVSCTLAADADMVWPRLLQVDTLRYIAWPLMGFSPMNSEPKGQWTEGVPYAFRLRLFGLLPFGGRHVIRIDKIEKAALEVQSYESNQIVTTWNHHIKLAPLPNGRARYTDTVRIGAGRLTPAVALWAKLFYRHRQRRWRKLLRDERQG